MSVASLPIPVTLESGPAWEIARLFPHQGHWDEGDFLLLSEMTNHLIELVDGRIEVLDMPKKSHQKRARAFADALDVFCRGHGITGESVLAAYPVRVAGGRFREPDVVFAFDPARLGDDFGERPDLVVEVVSKDRDRDFVHKRLDYAAAGISEYWIADPHEQRVIVLVLRDGVYVEHGRYGMADVARSVVVEGFELGARALLE